MNWTELACCGRVAGGQIWSLEGHEVYRGLVTGLKFNQPEHYIEFTTSKLEVWEESNKEWVGINNLVGNSIIANTKETILLPGSNGAFTFDVPLIGTMVVFLNDVTPPKNVDEFRSVYAV